MQASPDETRYSAGSPVISGGMIGKRRDLVEVAVEVGDPELHVGQRLLARLRHMRERDDAPLAAVRGLAGLVRRLGVDAPVRRMRLERVVRGAADRDHADAVLAGLQRAGRRARRGDRHLHHRLRVARKLQPRLAQVEPVGLLRHHAAGHQLDDHVERLVELAPLVLGLQPHLVGVVDQRARPDAEHRAPARLVVELHHAARERERVVIGQRHHAGAEANVARALRRGRR